MTGPWSLEEVVVLLEYSTGHIINLTWFTLLVFYEPLRILPRFEGKTDYYHCHGCHSARLRQTTHGSPITLTVKQG